MMVSLTNVLVVITLLIYNVSSTETEASSNSTNPEARIVGGFPISINYAPYTVSVRLKVYEEVYYGSGHACGGVVISQRLVATTAYCCFNTVTSKFRSADEFVLVMGSTFLEEKNDNTQEYEKQQVLVHEQFDSKDLNNDIALMFINGYIPWNSTAVKALPLNSVQLSAGTECSVSGWGALEQGGVLSDLLQQVQLPLIGYVDCMVVYKDLRLSQVCAGSMSGGTGTCLGDTGAPLECNGRLTGLMSYARGCALAGYPGVYTNIVYHQSWIDKQNNSLDYSAYGNTGLKLRVGYGIYTTIIAVLAGFLLM